MFTYFVEEVAAGKFSPDKHAGSGRKCSTSAEEKTCTVIERQTEVNAVVLFAFYASLV